MTSGTNRVVGSDQRHVGWIAIASPPEGGGELEVRNRIDGRVAAGFARRAAGEGRRRRSLLSYNPPRYASSCP